MITSLQRPRDFCQGRPQKVGRTRSLELKIRPYGDVLITSAGDVLKTKNHVRIARIIMETEMQNKRREKNKLKKEIVCISIH